MNKLWRLLRNELAVVLAMRRWRRRRARDTISSPKPQGHRQQLGRWQASTGVALVNGKHASSLARRRAAMKVIRMALARHTNALQDELSRLHFQMQRLPSKQCDMPWGASGVSLRQLHSEQLARTQDAQAAKSLLDELEDCVEEANE